MGAAKPGRIKEGVRTTLIVSTAISILISAFLFFFGELPLQLFTREFAVVQAGMDKFRIVAPFYMMMGFFGILSGVVRGCGHTTAPMLIGILSMFWEGFRWQCCFPAGSAPTGSIGPSRCAGLWRRLS